MPRRIALALALTLTAIVTFGVIAVGAQTGVFGEENATKKATEPATLAPPPPTAAPAQVPTPIVVIDYQYVEDPAPKPTAAGPTAVPPTATTAAAVLVPAPAKQAEDTHELGGGEPEGEDD